VSADPWAMQIGVFIESRLRRRLVLKQIWASPTTRRVIWKQLCSFPACGEDLVVAHFFYVFYVGLDGGEEGFEFGAGAKALQVAFLGVPFDAQDVMVCVFGAVRQIIGQAMGRGSERFYGFFVGLLEGAASRFVDLVPRVFHDHDGSWVRYWGLAQDYFFRAGSSLGARIARLRYPFSCNFFAAPSFVQTIFDTSEWASPVGTKL
jgi:hypothetical protein